MIIGNDVGSETKLDDKSRRYLANKQNNDFEVCTFGSLCRNVRNWSKRPVVLRERLGKLEIKHLHSDPKFFFNLSRDDLHITRAQIVELKNWGYEIDEWLKGERLALNHKYVNFESARLTRNFRKQKRTKTPDR